MPRHPNSAAATIIINYCAKRRHRPSVRHNWHNYFWLMTSFNVAWQQRDSKTSAKTAIKSQLNGVQSSGNQQQH